MNAKKGRPKDQRVRFVVRLLESDANLMAIIGDGHVSSGIEMVIDEAIRSGRHKLMLKVTTTSEFIPRPAPAPAVDPRLMGRFGPKQIRGANGEMRPMTLADLAAEDERRRAI